MSLFGGAFQIIAKFELQFPFALSSASTPDPAPILLSMGAEAPIAYPIPCFDKRGHARIRFCMTKILTVRLPAGLHDKAEARAMRLGLDRAKYVRSLIEDDLSGARGKTPRVFASEDLVGLYEGDTGPATNASARERLRARAAARR